jgi:hypothetical protein
MSKAAAVRSGRVEMRSAREKRRRRVSCLCARRRSACGGAFYEVRGERIRGAVRAAKFRKFEVPMRWLEGGSGMREATFGAWLRALLDRLARLLKAHPRWC